MPRPAGRAMDLAGHGKDHRPMECKKERNLDMCGCTYTSCDKQGVCCDCLAYHLKSRQLPGCCFPPDVEKTYDRSFQAFAKAWNL